MEARAHAPNQLISEWREASDGEADELTPHICGSGVVRRHPHSYVNISLVVRGRLLSPPHKLTRACKLDGKHSANMARWLRGHLDLELPILRDIYPSSRTQTTNFSCQSGAGTYPAAYQVPTLGPRSPEELLRA